MSETEKRKREGKGDFVSDPRFARLHTDARFQVFPNKQRKVEIDERFKGVLTDERFQHRAPVDKRGRKVKKEKKNENLARFYRLQGENEAADDEEAKLPESKGKPQKSKKSGRLQKAKAISAALEAADEQQEPADPEVSLHLKKDQRKEKPATELAPPSEPDAESDEEPESESESEEDSDAEAKQRWARLRGLAGPETSSEEDEASGSDTDAEVPDEDLDEEELDPTEWGVGAMAANFDEEVPMMEGEGTARVALLDMDWEHVRALDILMVLRSFLAEGQRIERVTVYPSDFGMEQMAAEARLGPQSVFGSKARPAANGSGGSARPDGGTEPDEDGSDDGDDDAGQGTADRPEADSESDAEVNQRRLRMYERSKLRYYFAVIECDGVPTASHLYAQCDGLEFELSANRMDLRFIPEGQGFADRAPRESATDSPAGYEPPPFFTTAALQHSNVKLTWDATPDERRRALSKKVRAEELRDDDFKAYLGSDSEAEGQDGQGPEAASMAEYRRRLLSGTDDGAQRKGGKDWGVPEDAQEDSSDGEGGAKAGAKAEGDMDMQVTFDSGLETLGERLASKKGSKAAQTLWEAYEKRRREKRQAAKRMGKHHASSSEDDSDGAASDEEGIAAAADDPFFAPEEDPFSDPFFQGGDKAGKKQGKKAAETAADKDARRRKKEQQREAAAAAEAEVARKRAELELLLMDESAMHQAKPASGEEGGKLGKSKLSRKERARLKKDAKRQERKAGSDDEDLAADMPAFKAKLDDARFCAIFNNPAFALDPTDPRFGQSAGAQELASAVAKCKQKQRSSAALDQAPPSGEAAPPAAANGKAGKPSGKTGAESAQLKAMVAGLKNKGAKKLKDKASKSTKPSKAHGKKI